MAVITTDVSSSLYFSSFDDGEGNASVTHTYNNVALTATDENVLTAINALASLQTKTIDETGRTNKSDIVPE